MNIDNLSENNLYYTGSKKENYPHYVNKVIELAKKFYNENKTSKSSHVILYGEGKAVERDGGMEDIQSNPDLYNDGELAFVLKKYPSSTPQFSFGRELPYKESKLPNGTGEIGFITYQDENCEFIVKVPASIPQNNRLQFQAKILKTLQGKE